MITIIPAIDLIEGKCVRLSNGDYSTKKIYRDNPVEVAKEFEAAGIRRLHLVDLDGAKAGTPKNTSVLEQIAKETNLLIDYGGGLKTDADVQRVFDAGVTYASIGSIAVKAPEIFDGWIQKYGPDSFMLGADVRNGKISIGGWLEQTEIDVVDFIQQHLQKRISHVFCTDISKDGLLTGPSVNLYHHIIAKCPGLRLIASGGVSSIEDILELNQIGCEGVIVGKALYEGNILLEDLINYND
ncbi:1-(5-phosphoribosyl)-5-[(5-phosphoribosylamino)methylideneamino]imidazole-4-carboxamide isomerase [soil metagenome]